MTLNGMLIEIARFMVLFFVPFILSTVLCIFLNPISIRDILICIFIVAGTYVGIFCVMLIIMIKIVKR